MHESSHAVWLWRSVSAAYNGIRRSLADFLEARLSLLSTTVQIRCLVDLFLRNHCGERAFHGASWLRTCYCVSVVFRGGWELFPVVIASSTRAKKVR